jgi:hypothetical protein
VLPSPTPIYGSQFDSDTNDAFVFISPEMTSEPRSMVPRPAEEPTLALHNSLPLHENNCLL